MRTMVLRTTAKIIAMIDLVSVCLIDSKWIGFLIIALVCTGYLVLYGYQNDWFDCKEMR